MRGGRAKLPVLAEVSAFVPGAEQVWSLRRADFERLTKLADRLEDKCTVLVTGGSELGGPLAIALAGAAGAAGRRTVLVECDIARPRLAVDLGLEPTPGLHEYLRWEATPEQVLQPVALAGPAAGAASEPVVFVAAGRQAPDPTILLGLQSFRHMCAKLGAAYDLVILVGPGLTEGGSGLAAIAACANFLLVAITPEQTSRRAARGLRGAVADLPVSTLGAVVVGAGE
jgi:MinD-like ATPase involved in chromosome partitioning or flagellar assembly